MNISYKKSAKTYYGAMGLTKKQFIEAHEISCPDGDHDYETVSDVVQAILEHETFTDGQKVIALMELGKYMAEAKLKTILQLSRIFGDDDDETVHISEQTITKEQFDQIRLALADKTVTH